MKRNIFTKIVFGLVFVGMVGLVGCVDDIQADVQTDAQAARATANLVNWCMNDEEFCGYSASSSLQKNLGKDKFMFKPTYIGPEEYYPEFMEQWEMDKASSFETSGVPFEGNMLDNRTRCYQVCFSMTSRVIKR